MNLKRGLHFIKLRVWGILRGALIKDFGHNTRIHLPKSPLRGLQLQITGSNHRIEIEDGVQIGRLEIHIGGNNNRLRIRQEASISDRTHIWLLFSNNSIDIGERTEFLGGCIWTGNDGCRIEIGSDCLFAGNLDIRCGDGHSIYDSQSGERLNLASHIVIGDNVWLARQVSILKNVTIGSGSVVGALSLVTRDVPENAVAAGVPAKVIRQGIRWEP